MLNRNNKNENYFIFSERVVLILSLLSRLSCTLVPGAECQRDGYPVFL